MKSMYVSEIGSFGDSHYEPKISAWMIEKIRAVPVFLNKTHLIELNLS
jgi:hypothetical protein